MEVPLEQRDEGIGPMPPETRGRIGRFVRLVFRAVLGLIAVVAILLIGIYAVLAFTEGERAPARGIFRRSLQRPLVIAHRGGAKIGPENTLEVLRKSQALGVDVLEIDVRLTADGEFAVIHDSKVDRTTDGTGDVSSMTIGELRSLDAGHDFSPDGGVTFPYRGKGVRIPTLAEVLTEFTSSNINIEAKQIDEGYADALCSLLRSSSSPERIVVASASDSFLETFRMSCAEFPTSASFTEVTQFLVYQKIGVAHSYSPSMNAMQVPLGLPAVTIVDPDFIDAARERNFEVHVWTINDESKMTELIGLGVDGIMTDRPDLLLRLLSR